MENPHASSGPDASATTPMGGFTGPLRWDWRLLETDVTGKIACIQSVCSAIGSDWCEDEEILPSRIWWPTPRHWGLALLGVLLGGHVHRILALADS